MATPDRTGVLLGMDIGRVNTRVVVFGISEGKYCVQASKMARTEFGHEGHLAAGVHGALEKHQHDLNKNFILPVESQAGQIAINQQVMDQAGLILSAFPKVNAAVFGLTAKGSLAAGLELAAKLPVNVVGAFGLEHLADESAVIESLFEERPDILILTGGEDSGAEKPLTRWIEVFRLVCRVLPEEVRPIVFFAGNPKLDSVIRRRLEPPSRLVILPNLQPNFGEQDDVPSQAAVGQHIISRSMEKLSGLQGLSRLAGELVGTRGFMLDRMVRFISRPERQRPAAEKRILAIDLGAGSTMVCAGIDGQSAAFRQEILDNSSGEWLDRADSFTHQWAATPVNRVDVKNYLANQHLFPARIPQTLTELALSQSLARYRIRSAMQGLVERAGSVPFEEETGLRSHYEMIIASGAVLTGAPTPGQAMLMLLDGLQPWRETKLVLDRFHILPLLGLLGETEPMLPVHILDSDAFANLGTVIPVLSEAAEGVMILKVNVSLGSGKSYDVDIPKGALRRLIISPGESVTLTLEPFPEADVGEGPGVTRRIDVKSGALGVVIDARGRPVVLSEDADERLEQIRHWLWTLGG